MNQQLMAFGLLAFVAIVVLGIAMMPSCGPREVMVRGTFGFVCVEGHR